MQNSSGKNREPKVAVVSPGLLPVPPVIGGSVETVIQKMAETTAKKFAVSIYSPQHRSLPREEQKTSISYYRFPSANYSEYFKLVRGHVNTQKYKIIQVENRPLFIPQTKAANPQSKFICSLHSLVHIEPRLISPSLTRSIFLRCDKVLVYSKFMQQQLVRMYPKAADRFQFIHLATDHKRFKPRWEPEVLARTQRIKKALGIPENSKIILFAGRVIPKKGVHILIDALKEILKQDPNCYLVVVGSNWFGNKGTTPYASELHQQSQRIASKIKFTNYVSQKDLPNFFAIADVFVCPSQWDEPFGLVNVEAMSSGVPVVASLRGGIPEILSDGVEGFLVNNESSAQAFAGPILRVLSDPVLGRNMGIKGRQKVERYFNWKRAGIEMSKLYEELINN